MENNGNDNVIDFYAPGLNDQQHTVSAPCVCLL